MRVLEIIVGHVIYNPAFTYKFQLKTTLDGNYQWALQLSEAMLDTQNCVTEARVNIS